jgi:hypothetical protein
VTQYPQFWTAIKQLLDNFSHQHYGSLQGNLNHKYTNVTRKRQHQLTNSSSWTVEGPNIRRARAAALPNASRESISPPGRLPGIPAPAQWSTLNLNYKKEGRGLGRELISHLKEEKRRQACAPFSARAPGRRSGWSCARRRVDEPSEGHRRSRVSPACGSVWSRVCLDLLGFGNDVQVVTGRRVARSECGPFPVQAAKTSSRWAAALRLPADCWTR